MDRSPLLTRKLNKCVHVPEDERRQWTVGLVGRVAAERRAPKVVGQDGDDGALAAHVAVFHDRRDVVVDKVPVETVGEGHPYQQGGQDEQAEVRAAPLAVTNSLATAGSIAAAAASAVSAAASAAAVTEECVESICR